MEQLSRERPVFHSEADFQHALAWRLHQMWPEAKVRLEFRAAQVNRRCYLDIWAEVEAQSVAIELKYKTRALSAIHVAERFDLASHGAPRIWGATIS